MLEVYPAGEAPIPERTAVRCVAQFVDVGKLIPFGAGPGAGSRDAGTGINR